MYLPIATKYLGPFKHLLFYSYSGQNDEQRHMSTLIPDILKIIDSFIKMKPPPHPTSNIDEFQIVLEFQCTPPRPRGRHIRIKAER